MKFLAEEGDEAWAATLTAFLLDWKDDPRTQQGLPEAQFQAADQRDRTLVRHGRQTPPRRQPGQGRNLWEACSQLALGQPFRPNVPAVGP